MSYKPKNKSPFIFFLIIIIIIMIITVVVDLAKNEQLLNIPGNAGILDLSTCQNYLAALTKDNHVYLWDWNVLPGDPVKNGVTSRRAMAIVIGLDRIVQYKPEPYNTLTIQNIDTDDKKVDFPLGFRYRLNHIAATQDRSILTALLSRTSKSDGNETTVYQLVTIDPQKEQYHSIINIGTDSADYQLNHCAISDDGKWGIILGAKDNQGVIILINVSQKQIVRETVYSEVKLFSRAAFAPKGNNWFFAGGDNMILYKIQTDTGQELRIPLIENYSPTASKTPFYDIAVSPDGKIVAAITTKGNSGVWDCTTGEKLIKSLSHIKISSTVAFSPDSRFLAVGRLQNGGNISIIPLPE